MEEIGERNDDKKERGESGKEKRETKSEIEGDCSGDRRERKW